MDHELLHLWNDNNVRKNLDLLLEELLCRCVLIIRPDLSYVNRFYGFKYATELRYWMAFINLRIHGEKVCGELPILHNFQAKYLNEPRIILAVMSQGDLL